MQTSSPTRPASLRRWRDYYASYGARERSRTPPERFAPSGPSREELEALGRGGAAERMSLAVPAGTSALVLFNKLC